jgi:SAM-dependent methyltransferase
MAETVYTEWQQAEIARSDVEARNTSSQGLIYGPGQIERYMAPPIDSVYPLEYAYALLGDVRGRKVLDLGCGSGENSFLLSRRGADVIGLDLSESLIALAKQRVHLNGGTAEPLQFLSASAHHLPLPDNSVDVVFGVAILHHLDLDQTAAEVYRVLKPGGRAIFKEPVRDSKVMIALRKCIPYQAPDVSPFERPLTADEVARFSLRFRVTANRSFMLPFVPALQMLPVAARWRTGAYKLDGALLRRFGGLSRYSSIRVFALAK